MKLRKVKVFQMTEIVCCLVKFSGEAIRFAQASKGKSYILRTPRHLTKPFKLEQISLSLLSQPASQARQISLIIQLHHKTCSNTQAYMWFPCRSHRTTVRLHHLSPSGRFSCCFLNGSNKFFFILLESFDCSGKKY
jgi:hypothetical protein